MEPITAYIMGFAHATCLSCFAILALNRWHLKKRRALLVGIAKAIRESKP